MMKKILALGVCALTACGVQTSRPTPSNFTVAIDAALVNPQRIATFDSTDTCIVVDSSRDAKQLRVLQKYGLVDVVPHGNAGQKPRFTYTALGSADRIGTNLCFAHITVSAIRNIMLIDQMAHVDYRYKILDVAAWARSSEVQAAFPEIKTMLKGEDPFDSRKATLFLTQGRWVARAV
jgi:hypothetical protein